jgi:PAS domain S-box-containing protein
MALDVTEIHHLEAELSHAHMLREALVEHALDAIVVLDNRGCVRLFNAAAEALLGYPREQLLGRRAPQGLVPKALLRPIRDERDPGVSQETAVRTATGEEVPVRLAGVRLRHEGRLVGSAFTFQDLREVRQLQREKLDAERLAAVGETVAGLAHGIKNILTGLEGGMYVASVGVQKGEEERVRKGWEMLERNVGRISTLVKSLLAFTRGEQPRVALVSPATVVRDVVGLFRDAAEQHGITIIAEVAEDVRPAPLDAEGLHTCLANLISNAMDACLVSHTPSCSITVRLAEANDVITLEVTDTGCGMDYEVKQKAFTSFFTTKGAGGTGLGLLLTRKIVQQHGGSVTFDSTAGQGTVFCLRFPRERLPRLEGPANEPPRDLPGRRQNSAASPGSQLSEE